MPAQIVDCKILELKESLPFSRCRIYREKAYTSKIHQFFNTKYQVNKKNTHYLDHR